MKKSLLLIFLSAIVLAGCSNTNNAVNDVDMKSSFNKKKECANLENNVKQQIADIKNNLQIKMWWREETTRTIDQVFYSQILDSCAYSVNVYWKNTEDFEVRFYNYFTRDFLWTSAVCNNEKCSHERWEYEKLIEEFKWE